MIVRSDGRGGAARRRVCTGGPDKSYCVNSASPTRPPSLFVGAVVPGRHCCSRHRSCPDRIRVPIYIEVCRRPTRHCPDRAPEAQTDTLPAADDKRIAKPRPICAGRTTVVRSGRRRYLLRVCTLARVCLRVWHPRFARTKCVIFGKQGCVFANHDFIIRIVKYIFIIFFFWWFNGKRKISCLICNPRKIVK